jgi:hypothetical protein
MRGNKPEDHPLIAEAALLFDQRAGRYTADDLAKLEDSLAKYADSPALADAIGLLLQFAQYVETHLSNKNAADALLDVALTQTLALERLNKSLEEKHADADRDRHKAFCKFSGG